MSAGRVARCLALTLTLVGCAAPPPRVDYPPPRPPPAPPTSLPAAPAPPAPPALSGGPVVVAGAGVDLQFERGLLLSDTFYRNPDLLMQQVSPSGAMGVNRGWEAGSGRGEWFIDEQRFANTLIGAGVNRNRRDLIDAGLRALEWGFARQGPEGGFVSHEPVASAAYFVAAAAHSIWLLERAGLAAPFVSRIDALRPRLIRSAAWLVRASIDDSAVAQLQGFASRRVVLGYALAMTGRVTEDAALARAGEAHLREALAEQHPSGYLVERGGYDVSFHAEAVVYLLRFLDHAASASARRDLEPQVSRAVQWLASRVGRDGVMQVAGSTRVVGGVERDRTGQPRRLSTVAVVRALGLARYVFGEARYEALARSVANARQPG